MGTVHADATVNGHPGRRWSASSHVRATSRRCQARSVAGGHREHLGPAAAGDRPGQGREPEPAGWLAGSGPGRLAGAVPRFRPEHQQFGVLGRITPGVHHQRAEQAAHQQVDTGRRPRRSSSDDLNPEDCTGNRAEARSCNRAPQRQGGDQGAVGPVRLRADDLTAQDRNLVPQYQDLRVLRGLASREERQPAEQPDREQIDEANEHECRG